MDLVKVRQDRQKGFFYPVDSKTTIALMAMAIAEVAAKR